MADEWGQADEADFSFDGSNYSKDDLGGGEGLVDKDGWYHMEVADVVPQLDTLSNQGKAVSPHVRFDLVVLETAEGQSPAGSRHFHKLYVAAKGGEPPKEGAIKSALRWGLGLGLLDCIEKDGREVIVDKATGSTKIPVSIWSRAKGMQIIARIAKGKDEKDADGNLKYEGKFEIPFGRCYQVDHPDVATVPKNKESLAMIGKKSATPPGKGGEAGGAAGAAKTPPKSPPQKPAETAKAPSADDDLGDL